MATPVALEVFTSWVALQGARKRCVPCSGRQIGGGLVKFVSSGALSLGARKGFRCARAPHLLMRAIDPTGPAVASVCLNGSFVACGFRVSMTVAGAILAAHFSLEIRPCLR